MPLPVPTIAGIIIALIVLFAFKLWPRSKRPPGKRPHRARRNRPQRQHAAQLYPIHGPIAEYKPVIDPSPLLTREARDATQKALLEKREPRTDI